MAGKFIFQLGTNNWQRQGEFAPGSGILHEAHHNAYNAMEGVECFSMYPSSKQTQPEEADAKYRVFKLDHDIPICESASPTSSKRWHSMSDAEFSGYVARLETEVYDYMKECEAKTGRNFDIVIAHHSFVNPLVLRNVLKKRAAEGLPKATLYCFVHGTALKMYRWELGGKNVEEFPMRFHKMILEEKLFDDIEHGINACFVISEEQKAGIAEIFPSFPQDRVIVAPNGINVEIFKPATKSLKDVITECTREILWPAEAPTPERCAEYTQMIIFCGKFAEWKRLAALLEAAKLYEPDFPNLVTLCAGGGQPADIEVSKAYADKLGLKNTFFIGGRAQPVLAELYTVAELGCFPSFREPFGLVFVECMACKTPVIGANSGGPKDFVVPEVGCLVGEPPETTDLSTVMAGVVTLGKTLNETIRKALAEDWKKAKGEACIKLAHDKFTVGAQVSNMLKAASALPSSKFIFQLGTNNWQRQGEFAPGSGILHEAHHNAYNAMGGVQCYSMYPSSKQTQPEDPNAMYRVFKLEHDIPICESASPTSSKRWHSMSEEEFGAYVGRLESEVYDYMKECEAKAGKTFDIVIAHHSFVNPLVLRNVLKKRAAEGLPKATLYCFVHGTALKMYRWELGGKNVEEFPMRFHKMILEEKLFDDIENGINACFVISEEQKAGIAEIFPSFPQDRVIVAPNGINVEIFKPQSKSLKDVVTECTREILWPAEGPTPERCAEYTQMIIFCGKFAEWKRLAALLEAAKLYEPDFPNLVTLCAGGGQPADIEVSKTYADKLGLKNTFFIGGRGQPVLAELYTVAELGCFPSFREPFGLVFVECMACKTPVIGANSGGPKDFVVPEVGCLVDEPPETTDLSTVMAGVVTLGKTLNETIRKALAEDWKKTKGEACIKLAHDKFTVGAQVSNMLKAANKLS